MDLSQKKLIKSEWKNIEIPVSEQEQAVLQLIKQGFMNPNIRMNAHPSILSFLKMNHDEAMTFYIYDVFFREIIDPLLAFSAINAIKIPFKPPQLRKGVTIKKADQFRITNTQKIAKEKQTTTYEFVLLTVLSQMVNAQNTEKQSLHLYTLIHLRKSATIPHLNVHATDFIDAAIKAYLVNVSVLNVVMNSPEYIEKNSLLMRYADMQLYSHQRDLFCKFAGTAENCSPMLVLYIAPTGTGKTLSPLGLVQDDLHVIFVCSARHIGMSLAKNAISLGTRIGFAYGCNSSDDIRLHNYSAATYAVDKRSGGIGKVDNTNGSRVQIMISDIQSYLIAMNFMLEFHPETSLVLYWDEPTITMDYDEHPLHNLIHRNWAQNKLSKVVLSCATLPHPEEIQTTLNDFQLRFEGDDSCIIHIQSFDCKKSISLIDERQCCTLPHLMFSDYRELSRCVEHCQKNKTLLRYFDLAEIVRFLKHVVDPENIITHFGDIEHVSMTSIKTYYLNVLSELDEAKWHGYWTFLHDTQMPRLSLPPQPTNNSLLKSKSLDSAVVANSGTALFRTRSMAITPATVLITTPTLPSPFSGIMFTTTDAHTLTDGPSLYIAENVEKMGKFYLSKTPFPPQELEQIQQKIHRNSILQKRIAQTENIIEDKLGKDALKENKMDRENFSSEVKQLKAQLEQMRLEIACVKLPEYLVPNTLEHQRKWCGQPNYAPNAFRPDIRDEDVVRIMELSVDDTYKVLLLLGIGAFVNNTSVAYLEIIKQMAAEQKLFLLLASSDYIYGTNYQFCHSVIGKDLQMTQQKIIQALGRVGRNNIQQEYTVRFRNDELLKKLFLPIKTNPEAENMRRLFSA